ncbi:RNA binding protein, partial [Oryctes borbonicus]
MDYTVGSVADLISGCKTPNKPKVMQKKIKTKLKTITAEEKPNNESVTMVKKPKKRSISPQAKQVKSKKSKVLKQKARIEETNIHNGNKTEQTTEDKPAKNQREEVLTENSDSNNKTEEENPPKSKKNKGKSKKSQKQEEPVNPNHVTIFVGNLPIGISHKKLMKLFSKCGSVVNARIRGIPSADPKLSKRLTAIKKEFHPQRTSVHGYVTFANLADAQNALILNGKEYKEHHIRVNMASETKTPDKTKAIFLGNLSFAAEEEEL